MAVSATAALVYGVRCDRMALLDDQSLPSFYSAFDDPADASAEYSTRFDEEDDVLLAPTDLDAHLTDSVVYRPGVAIASVLLIGPFISAIVGVVLTALSGSIPLWLPLVLLLWLPIIALVWLLLKSVKVTPNAIACGRPLGQWRVFSFDEIERVEQHGMRLLIGARSGPPMAFTPALLQGGRELRRSILLRLPLHTLWGRLRVEAQEFSSLQGESDSEGAIAGVLTVRSRWRWTILDAFAAVVALALAFVAWEELVGASQLALAAICLLVALLLVFVALWMKQEIFLSEKGVIIRYTLLRREQVVFWSQVQVIEYTPAELALYFRGARRVLCAGPGALDVQEGRLMRQFIGRYCFSPVAPLSMRRSF